MEKVYNKLVRDNIPEIIKSKGESPVIRTLEMNEYKCELEKKLHEECVEVVEASGVDRVEELADVIEIVRALAKLENSTLEEVISVAHEKSEKRGAFEERIFLEKVISKD